MNRPDLLRDAFALHPTARRLVPLHDAESLARDVARFGEEWWQRHAGPYHDGGWEAIALWAPRGDAFEQRSFGGAFAATPALATCPAVRAVLDGFPCERNRVRLMRLRPGARILRHSDPLHTIDPRLVRVHVPIVTNDDVHFLVADRRVLMRPGETWHIDVRFPHAVHNAGATARVHLVMDFVRNDALDRLLADGEPVGRGRLLGYFAVHSLPARVQRALRLGN
jgi:hypothetical protein